jgi:hypothetical protein
MGSEKQYFFRPCDDLSRWAGEISLQKKQRRLKKRKLQISAHNHSMYTQKYDNIYTYYSHNLINFVLVLRDLV